MALTRLEVVRAWLLRTLMGFFYGLFVLLSSRPPSGSRKLPPVANPLLTMSATQLAHKIRRREVSVCARHDDILPFNVSIIFVLK